MFKHAVQILNDGDLSNKVIFLYIVLVPLLGLHVDVLLGIQLTTVTRFEILHCKQTLG